jgi:hypothetical protein
VTLVAPTGLDYNLQADVQITYDDGSQSEVERVTFVPRNTVSTTISLAPLVVGAAAGSGSFSFNGINTGNFVSSNFTLNNQLLANDVNMVVSEINPVVKVGDTEAPLTNTAYVELTDTFPFTFTDAGVAVDDVITADVLINGTVDLPTPPNANQFFNSASTVSAQAKFTVAGLNSYDSLDISVGSSSTVVHNKTAAATSSISAETVVAAEGTKSLNFVISAFTDGVIRSVAASSGIPITVTLTDVVNSLGTSTITAGGKSLNVSGEAISFTLTTNSVGQVAFTVTADKAVDGESFRINAVGSLGATPALSLDPTTVKFQEATFTLLPAVDGDFTIAPGGSIAVDYVVVDQFGNLAGANYQLAMTRVANSAVAANRDKAAEYASWSYVAPVSATGRASATIVDNGLAATEGSDTVTVSLQKAATAGGAFIAEPNSTNDTFVLTYENDLAATTSTALVNNNGIANAAATAVNPLRLETIALTSYDSRIGGSKPLFATNGAGTAGNISNTAVGVAPVTYAADMLRVYGQVKSAGNAGISGVAVRISGEGANFANAATLAAATLMLNDSITVFTDATGSYEAFVRSGKAGNQTLSVNAQGALSSVEVRFQNSTGVATGLTLAGPSNVASGARGDFIATVVDKFGKPVAGVAVNFKDNGPGVLNVTGAVTTDAFGEAQATLTTLAAESGTTVVTAFATIGGVLVTQTATVVVGKAAATSSDVVVNVGTFSGKLVVYALNAAGSEVSYKIAGKWVTQVVTSDLLQRYDRVVGATGKTIKVDIYVDGVLKLAKSVVTK